jgi:putative addiction module component (TIGR02574 family)
MQSAEDIVERASSLPVEERARIVDLLLRTLNSPDREVDKAWVEKATVRLDELRSGKAKPVPSDRVFARLGRRPAR